jgi:hypothetical protein
MFYEASNLNEVLRHISKGSEYKNFGTIRTPFVQCKTSLLIYYVVLRCNLRTSGMSSLPGNHYFSSKRKVIGPSTANSC